jgi:hypothetical protein
MKYGPLGEPRFTISNPPTAADTRACYNAIINTSRFWACIPRHPNRESPGKDLIRDRAVRSEAIAPAK